ncbi:hypothetical protein EJ110_NYTH53148 [Nymphaea thermarum]|nr:hypothetical protein EJ110_NYTH53148 [Nymphaea thermarum]
MVMAWPLNSMEPSIANLFTYPDTAHGIWEALNDLYSEQNNLNRVYQIQCEIATLTLHDQDVQWYIGRQRSLYDELLQYQPATSDPATYKQRFEEDQIFKVLTGLSEDYESLRTQILNTMPLPKFNVVCQMIQREVSRRRVMSILPKTDSIGDSQEKMACLSQSGTIQGVQRYHSNTQKTRSKLKCTHYRKLGHTRDHCWELVGRQGKEKGSSSIPDKDVNLANFVTKEDLEKFSQKFSKTNLVYSQPVGDVPEGKPYALMTATNNESWIVDSGATDHMTNDPTRLADLNKDLHRSVFSADGSSIEVAGIGQTTFFEKHIGST